MRPLLLTTGLLALAGAAAAQDRQLQLYNWGDYTSPELIEKFEGETGIDVTITDYDSNDVGSSRVDLQACKLEYSIVSPK